MALWFDNPFDVRKVEGVAPAGDIDYESPYFYEDEDEVVLRTDPGAMPTHWKQFVVFMPHFANITVDKEAGKLLPAFDVELQVDEFNPRQCAVSVSAGDMGGDGGDVVMSTTESGKPEAAPVKKQEPSLKDAIISAFLNERK